MLYTTVMFIFNNITWASCHKTMPFGAVASCWAWHRVANLLRSYTRRILFCPVLKYVDDFFACEPCGIKYTMAYGLAIVATTIGTVVDPKKPQDFMIEMVIICIHACLNWERKAMVPMLPEEKSAR